MKDHRLSEKVQTATRSALSRIVEYCIDENVSALLIAGDLFDGKERSAKTAAFLITELERLQKAGVLVFYIKGNHDAENPLTGAFEMPSNVRVFSGRGESQQIPNQDIWIHGVSFRDRHAPDSLLPKYPAPVAGALNIGMMHTSLSGAKGHDPYAPCKSSDLAGHGYDYWALGHVHKREVHSKCPWIVMPGMPQGRDIGEDGEKSATLLKIDGTNIELEEVPVAPVQFRKSICDISITDHEADVRGRIRSHLQGEAATSSADETIVRLILTGESKFAWQIRRDQDVWQESIQNLAEETGKLWIEKVEFDLSEKVTDTDTVHAVNELDNIMDLVRGEASFQDAARQEFEELLQLLPPERRLFLAPNEKATDQLLEGIAKQAKLSMLALMKGASN